MQYNNRGFRNIFGNFRRIIGYGMFLKCTHQHALNFFYIRFIKRERKRILEIATVKKHSFPIHPKVERNLFFF